MGTWIGTVFALSAVAASVVVAQAVPVSEHSGAPQPPVSASATPTPTPSSGTGGGQTGSGQSGDGQPGSTTPTPDPTGQMGGGQVGNPAPTPNPGGQVGGGQMGNPTPNPGPTAHMGNGHTERIRVPLQSMPAGTVSLSVDRHTGAVTAQVNAFGLAPGTQHRIGLYRSRDGGRPVVTFPDVTVDGNGQLVQTVTGTAQRRDALHGSLYFKIDLLPTGRQAQTIAVAHAPASRARRNRVTVALRSTIAQSGHATLDYDPATRRLTVSLRESGLVPGSEHAAHIHSGSCQVQGPVLYPLPDLVANGAGFASEKTTIPVQSAPPVSGWYVNVHDGTMNNILQADGQPGPLFQPLVCGNVRGRSIQQSTQPMPTQQPMPHQQPQPFSGTHS